MSSRSLFFQISSLSPERIIEICEEIRTQHRSDGDKVHNATLTSIAEPYSGALYTAQLDAIHPYLPGGDKKCFDNAFVGSTWFPYDPKRYWSPVDTWWKQYGVWGGMLSEAYRWDQIEASTTIWQNFKRTYALPWMHFALDMEADLDALVHPELGDDVTAGLEATLIELCKQAKEIEPHRSVQWSPFHWVPYNGNAELKFRLSSLFRNVEDYSGMGINFLDLQDGVGARPGVKSRENAQALLDVIRDSYPFPHAAMNVEWFTATPTGFQAVNRSSDEVWYATKGSRPGTDWEARYWFDAAALPPVPVPVSPKIKFFSREQWGAANLPRLGYHVPPNRRTEVHVHHTASIDLNDSTSNRWSEWEAVRYVKALQNARPDLGRDIPYNFVCAVNEDADTVFVFEGRGLFRTGAHTAGHNTAGLAWSFMGDGRNMDHRAAKAFVDVVTNEVRYHRANSFPNLATVRSPSGALVWGHSDSSSSKPHCPGPSIYPLLKGVAL